MKIERLTTTNDRGEKLTAGVERPVDGEPIGYALLVHCLAGDENSSAVANLCSGLTDRGIGVVRFDFTGFESRRKDDDGLNGSASAGDILTLARFMQEELAAPIFLIGHSFGGAVVLQTAQEIPSTKAVAVIGAPFGRDFIPNHVLDDSNLVRLGGTQFTLSMSSGDDLLDAERHVASLEAALMILHSPSDETISIDSATAMFESAAHPKSFLSLDGADHLLTDAGASRHAGDMLAAWIGKYVNAGHQEAKYIRPDDNRVYTRTGESGYATRIMANGHALVSDEPKSVGGTDAGPSPYDYVTAALGACTGMTLRMYADRKEWPLKGITVRLKHAKVHARDCETCEAGAKNIDQIDREIELDGPLTTEQRARLIDIANKCPVHQTLVGDVTIDTKESSAP